MSDKTCEANQHEWLKSQFPPDYQGWAVDCGANDGRYLSNTLALEEEGWNVLCIEADHRYRDELVNCRRTFALCAVSNTAREWGQWQGFPMQLSVPVLTLNQLLVMFGFPKLDILCLDIEGGEMDALQGIDLRRWKPKCIIAEDWNLTTKLDEYLAPFGYEFQEAHSFDRYFLRVGE